MKNKNNLPESWCVKNDGSQLFKDTVIKYIQNKYGSILDGSSLMYYGYSVKYDTCIDDSSSKFENVLTLSEFIELSKEIKEWEPKFGEKVIAYDKDGRSFKLIYLGEKDNYFLLIETYDFNSIFESTVGCSRPGLVWISEKIEII